MDLDCDWCVVYEIAFGVDACFHLTCFVWAGRKTPTYLLTCFVWGVFALVYIARNKILYSMLMNSDGIQIAKRLRLLDSSFVFFCFVLLLLFKKNSKNSGDYKSAFYTDR